uniref:Apyrase n=1 Tax=Calcidiscus leptoporus TaxID=127549 RepID=A0A7S0J6S8_9EUKA|mmetsp:Transcript_42047/g.98513  ORF Transcript_42047/g.98513 Transcript_42047/m.98513 type:complete len:316 (+) Transcript_42047:223-1170(+)
MEYSHSASACAHARRAAPQLLGMCDRTGILYKIDLTTGAAFPRWAIADGDGDEAKPFKGEWATVKGDKLWVGSPGVKWFDASGTTVLHRNPEWVKHMDSRGHIVNHDWGLVYAALRRSAGATSKGFLWHEAVHWDELNQLWVFLPRRWSEGRPDSRHVLDPAPNPRYDETRGANFLLLASEDFSNITMRRLGPLEPEWGFTSVRKVLGTTDTYVALKVREVKGEPMQSKLAVFDLQGRFLLDPPFASVPGANVKFEGVEFIGIPSMHRYIRGQGSDPSVSMAECKRRLKEHMADEASTSLLRPARVEMSAHVIAE